MVGTLVLRLKLGAKSSCTEPSNLGAKEVGAEPGDLTQRAALAPPSALLPPLLYLKRTEAPTVTAAHITIHCHRPHLPVPSAASEGKLPPLPFVLCFIVVCGVKIEETLG